MREIEADLLPIISVLFLSDVINGSSIRKSFSKRIIPLMPEGSEVGYNPNKRGRPSYSIKTAFIA